ncbi:hypothetical protein CLAFUW4_14335 [Fulvia fulva]|uniref:uncharacterized protein n=1 Tax=Passalora fulva TaxID=5499 RepID=UPI002852CF79|nr:uncharacterized protein CLAFUR5_20378 [Fulvia fulva]KAK4608952.1 hypothetical protein CLAFUR4_14334 [Fulvia fulva]KAK4610003.1 hypothetical protein CLAFUR0_14338 [Fulvia fulva]WMI39093.1 hypothetical protein CLAFUR5_20378 [Fulvia fulva]WPV22529.1 hypothetical protein CLAFUW4_14335 [Fulvia fulva]WPV37762.1 hypothetical protein CLAFUW7_14342 [Fulvia fulva]
MVSLGRKRPVSGAVNEAGDDHRPIHKRKRTSQKRPSPDQLRSLNQRRSPLLRLPRELRDLIIEEALPFCEGREFRLWYGKGTLPSGLLGTCHQLREETTELFFKTNTICITGRQNIEDMVDMWSKHHRLIKKVRLIPCERSSYERAIGVAASHAIDCDLDPKTVWAPYFQEPLSLSYEGAFGTFSGFVNYAGDTEPYDAERYAKLWDSAHWSRQDSRPAGDGAQLRQAAVVSLLLIVAAWNLVQHQVQQ